MSQQINAGQFVYPICAKCDDFDGRCQLKPNHIPVGTRDLAESTRKTIRFSQA